MIIKRVYLCIIAIVLLLVPLSFNGTSVYYAETEEEQTLEEQLDETIKEQLDSLDLSNLNKYFEQFCKENNIFEGSSLYDKIQQIINGEFSYNANSVISAVGNVFLEEILDFLPLISSIIAITVLGSLLIELKGSSHSMANIIHIVCFGVVIVLIMGAVVKMISLTSGTITSLQTQMEILFPILLTILTAIGGTVSVAVYQPAVAMLTTVVSTIFTSVLLPLFIFSLVLTIISHISPSIKLDKLASFSFTLFKWIIGIVFTIFMGFLAIQGITAGSVDTISFKTARYSLSTYIPIVGGYLSEGLNLILSSGLLIKNAIGSCGLLMMFGTILVPFIQVVLFMFVLKFLGAVLQPLSDNRMSNFMTSVSKLFVMPIVMILAVTFMYVIFVGIIMCTSVAF